MAFYSRLFEAEGCDGDAAGELLQWLPQLSPGEQAVLGSDMMLEEEEELTSAVTHGLRKGAGSGWLPADFFKHFWMILGTDLS